MQLPLEYCNRSMNLLLLAGGHGIHRPLGGKTKADQPKSKGKPTPAKKAKADPSKGKVKVTASKTFFKDPIL